jgi:DNA-binding NarL/FixJ family response regulator
MSKIRVLIIDDHPLLRMGIRGLIEGQPDLEVAADCADLASARAWLETQRADVAIVDRSLPDGDGLELLPTLKVQGTKTIILTVEDDDIEIRAAVEAGVDGYLLKSSDSDQILMAISMVLKDSAAFPAHILQKLSNGQVDAPLARLSAREIEIAESVAAGLSNKVIGARLHLSDNTVRNHLANIMQKLGFNNRVQVATLMLQHMRRKQK